MKLMQENIIGIKDFQYTSRSDINAVVETTEKSKYHIDDLLKLGGRFSREDLLKLLLTNYSGEDYGSVHWKKTTGGWTTPYVNTAYGKFLQMYPQLSQLSLDAGLISHLPEFIDFLGNNYRNAEDIFSLRERFKKELGNSTFWRGMMLTEEELLDIRSNGMDTPIITGIKASDYKKSKFEAHGLSIYMDELVEQHFHGGHHASPFISVSSHKDIAIVIGRHCGKKNDGRKFYLFEMQIPEIDRLFYTEHGLKAPLMTNELPGIFIELNSKKTQYDFGRNTESFIPWKINSNEIIAVSQPEVCMSKWNGFTIEGMI